MSYEQYNTALNAGRKEYRACLLKGGYPYLPALDEILSYAKVEYEVSLGVCEVPMELIVGTKTRRADQLFCRQLYAPFAYQHGICQQMDTVIQLSGGGGTA